MARPRKPAKRGRTLATREPRFDAFDAGAYFTTIHGARPPPQSDKGTRIRPRNLAELLKPYFETPFDQLPSRIRSYIESWPLSWDDLTPAERQAVAVQLDLQHSSSPQGRAKFRAGYEDEGRRSAMRQAVELRTLKRQLVREARKLEKTKARRSIASKRNAQARRRGKVDDDRLREMRDVLLRKGVPQRHLASRIRVWLVDDGIDITNRQIRTRLRGLN